MMTKQLQYFLIVVIIILFVFFINLLRKRKLDLKYSLIWIIALLGIGIFVIFPKLIEEISNLLGIYDPMNALFFICIAFLTCICVSLTVVVSRLSERLRRLTQEIAIHGGNKAEDNSTISIVENLNYQGNSGFRNS